MFKSILRQNKFQKCLKLSNIKCNNELLMNSKNNRNKISSIISSNYCHNEQNRSQTHFGFESVTNEEKFRRVNEVFSEVANKYDLMNDIMSFGVHRYWKRLLIERLNPYSGTKLLDTCGGTGDIAFEFIKKIKQNKDDHSKVVVCDINQEMLKVGQNRAQQLGLNDENLIEWVLGDAMCLPFEDNSFDAYTVGFGIRNVVNIEEALLEANRVLKKGAIFLCLEFSQLKNPLLEGFYDWYSFEIIPVLGEIFGRNWNSYQYLVESIRRFPDQQDFKVMIESAGFTLVEFTNLMDGIAAIHVGYKK